MQGQAQQAPGKGSDLSEMPRRKGPWIESPVTPKVLDELVPEQGPNSYAGGG